MFLYYRKKKCIEDELKELICNAELESTNKKLRNKKIREMEPLVAEIENTIDYNLDIFVITNEKHLKKEFYHLQEKQNQKNVTIQRIDDLKAELEDLNILNENQEKNLKYTKNNLSTGLTEAQKLVF